jgi:hypothetical protein
MRMSVFFGGTSVGGPAGVADAISAFERFGADHVFKIAQLAFCPPDLKAVTVTADGNAGGVVPAIFELAQTLNDDGNYLLFSDIADDATHRVLSWTDYRARKRDSVIPAMSK